MDLKSHRSVVSMKGHDSIINTWVRWEFLYCVPLRYWQRIQAMYNSGRKLVWALWVFTMAYSGEDQRAKRRWCSETFQRDARLELVRELSREGRDINSYECVALALAMHKKFLLRQRASERTGSIACSQCRFATERHQLEVREAEEAIVSLNVFSTWSYGSGPFVHRILVTLMLLPWTIKCGVIFMT